MFKFVPRREGQHLGGIDVSSRAPHPYNLFSPFTKSPVPIPHPCIPNVKAASVEALWQGCKVFSPDGRPDWTVLQGKKKPKRGVKPYGTWAGGKIITDPGEARRKIYIPAYCWYLENCLPKNLVYHLLSMGARKTVYLYDFDSNSNPDSPRPLAHASVLTEWLNKKLNQKSLRRV